MALEFDLIPRRYARRRKRRRRAGGHQRQRHAHFFLRHGDQRSDRAGIHRHFDLGFAGRRELGHAPDSEAAAALLPWRDARRARTGAIARK